MFGVRFKALTCMVHHILSQVLSFLVCARGSYLYCDCVRCARLRLLPASFSCWLPRATWRHSASAFGCCAVPRATLISCAGICINMLHASVSALYTLCKTRHGKLSLNLAHLRGARHFLNKCHISDACVLRAVYTEPGRTHLTLCTRPHV